MRGREKTESIDTWMTSNWSAAVSFGSNLLEQNVKEKHMCMHKCMLCVVCCLATNRNSSVEVNCPGTYCRLHCKYIHC